MMAEDTGRPAVSVLVPVRNEEGRIDAALAGMRAQTLGPQAEFLLLEGGSTDGTLAELRRVVEDDPRFQLLERPGWNVPRRLNLGLERAQGQVIARMDTHAVFPPTYLEDGVRRLAQGDVAAVGGPQIAVGQGPWSRRVSLALRSGMGRGGAQFRHLSANEREVDSNYCGLWPRAVLEAHGGWNGQASHGEDAELAVRIRGSGGRLVCVPGMAARYLPREDLRSLAVQYFGYAFRRSWMARRDPAALRRSHVLPPLLVLTGAGAVTPAPAARPARWALTTYLASVLAESLRLARHEPWRDRVALPLVFITMHVAWGTGFLAGCASHGPPRGVLRSVQPRPANTAFSVSQTISASRRRLRRLT